MRSPPHTPKQLVDDDHFARVLDEVMVGGVKRSGIGAVER
jgi:hypothetical protein